MPRCTSIKIDRYASRLARSWPNRKVPRSVTLPSLLALIFWPNRTLAAKLKGPTLPPVQLHELCCDVSCVEVQWCARIIPLHHCEIGQGVNECKLVTGDEQSLSQ